MSKASWALASLAERSLLESSCIPLSKCPPGERVSVNHLGPAGGNLSMGKHFESLGHNIQSAAPDK